MLSLLLSPYILDLHVFIETLQDPEQYSSFYRTEEKQANCTTSKAVDVGSRPR